MHEFVLVNFTYCIYLWLYRLGDVLSSLTSEKDSIPYENSMLTRILADSLGENFFFSVHAFFLSFHSEFFLV